MNLALVPLLIGALLLVSGDRDVDQVQLLLSGEHELVEIREGALIVGDAAVGLPVGTRVSGPIYVIAGEVTIDGTVEGDVTQLAGTVRVGPEAVVTGELRHVAGSLTVAPGAEIGRRTSLDLSGTGDRRGGLVAQVALALLLTGAGYQIARRRRDALANVAAAASGHPVISVTVGLLVTLTAVALLVFMAFTLVLIPFTAIGVIAGLLTLAYGLIAFGHLIGSRLPVRRPATATALGVLSILILLRVLGLVPFMGDLLVGGVVLTGIGAVLITYFGVSPFRSDAIAGPGVDRSRPIEQ